MSAGLDERRWLPIAELPSTLLLELEAGAVEVRRHPDSRRRYPFALLIPIGVGLLTVGLLGLLFVYRPPFEFGPRWIPLVAGAAVFGVWLAWRRTPEHRPASGQALVAGPASLVIVDAAAVEVLPAENLALEDGAVRYRDARVHDGVSDELAAAITEAIERAADAGARDADPWRAAAAAGSGAHAIRSRRPLVIGGLAGAAGAVALELLVGAVREHPGQAHWRVLERHAENLAGQVLEQLEDRSHQRRLADLGSATDEASSSFAVLPLIEEAEIYQLDAAERARIVGRYAELASAEVEHTRMLDEVVRRLRVAIERELDGGFRDAARRRIRVLAMERAAGASYLSDLPLELIDEAAELGLAPELLAELRLSAGAVVRAGLLAAGSLDEVDRGWFEAMERYQLGDELEAEARVRVGELARAALARSRTAGEVIGVLDVAHAGVVDEPAPLLAEARERFARFARRDLRSAGRHDFRSYLTVAREYELGDEFVDELYQRWRDRALSDIAAARTSDALDTAVRHWYEPGDDILRDMLRGPIQGRLSSLAVGAAEADAVAALIELADLIGADEVGDLRAIQVALAHGEAVQAEGAGGITAARRFLVLPGVPATQAAEVTALLAERCTAAFADAGDEPALVALAAALCAEAEPALRWSTAGDTELARRGARMLIARVTTLADERGVPLSLRELNVRPGTGHVALAVEQRGAWHVAPDITGHQQRPCSYRVAGVEVAAGRALTLDGVCVRRHGD
jgi:hypothetical protein